MNEKRSRNNGEKSATNWWKWAFLSLSGLILIGIFLLLRALQPVSIEENNTEIPDQVEKEVSLVSSVTTEDAETIMNRYLDSMIEDENVSYEIILEDQLEIHSNVELFNLTIPYTLYFDPYVTEEGNLQLRADSIQLANFSMPVSAVLSLLANELELPPFIGVDSAAKMIVIDFVELSSQYDIGIRLNKIDLENNEIELKLSLNEATLLKAMNFEEKSQSSVEE